MCVLNWEVGQPSCPVLFPHHQLCSNFKAKFQSFLHHRDLVDKLADELIFKLQVLHVLASDEFFDGIQVFLMHLLTGFFFKESVFFVLQLVDFFD